MYIYIFLLSINCGVNKSSTCNKRSCASVCETAKAAIDFVQNNVLGIDSGFIRYFTLLYILKVSFLIDSLRLMIKGFTIEAEIKGTYLSVYMDIVFGLTKSKLYIT